MLEVLFILLQMHTTFSSQLHNVRSVAQGLSLRQAGDISLLPCVGKQRMRSGCSEGSVRAGRRTGKDQVNRTVTAGPEDCGEEA